MSDGTYRDKWHHEVIQVYRSPMPRLRRQAKNAMKRGFTLIEMITVLAVLGILAGASVVVFFGGRSESKNDKARGDIQVIQQALEAYKARFGDYPRIPNPYTGLGVVDTKEEYLLNALFGRIGPAHQAISGIPVMLNSAVLDFANQSLPYKDENVAADALKSNWIVDPWGNAYEYDYQPNLITWLEFGYRLRSLGADGTSGTEDDILAE